MTRQLQLSIQSEPITTSVEFESCIAKVYSIQHYVIKFVSHLRQVCGFQQVPRLHPPIKLTATI